ncbi:unnamed protein product [Closterium sp. Yama58-4]|nr:unnamed protein product [Closterium sp. Yama58-4]
MTITICTLTTALHFPASPSAVTLAFSSPFRSAAFSSADGTSASSSASPSASSSPSPSASTWPRAFPVMSPSVVPIPCPSDAAAARCSAIDGESFPAVPSVPRGVVTSDTAAADVSLADWLNEVAASKVQTAPRVVVQKQQQQLMRQWFRNALHGLVSPGFPQVNRASQVNQVNTFKLYGMGYSPFVRRVLLTLHELGIEDYEWEQVDAPKGEARTPAYLAKQPFGKVPLLEDDGECIWESRAIMRYLADKYGAERGVNLLGKDALERGRVNQWIETEVNAYTPEAVTIASERVFKKFRKLGEPDEEKVAAATKKLEKILDVYEKHLEGREYLVGDSFTLADLTHLLVTEHLKMAGVGDLFDSRPNVKAWLSRLYSRPSWGKVNEVAPLPTI